MNVRLEMDIENILKKLCQEGNVLHGTPHRYEQYENNVFIPRNHNIIANKSPIHAIYHALFDTSKTKLHTYTKNKHTYSSVEVKNSNDFQREKGLIYVFSAEGFHKQGWMYIQNPKTPLLKTMNIITVTKDDFKPPIYNYNISIIKEKTF